MVGARPESMLAMLEMVAEKWGGAEGYVKGACGLTDDEVERVRVVLTAPEAKARENTRSGVWDRFWNFFNRTWESCERLVSFQNPRAEIRVESRNEDS